jgi:hypothetical protein
MAPSTTTHSSARGAWTLDTLAKEFGLIEKGDEPYTRTGRAQMATLLAQEEVSDVYSTLNTEFLVGANLEIFKNTAGVGKRGVEFDVNFHYNTLTFTSDS